MGNEMPATAAETSIRISPAQCLERGLIPAAIEVTWDASPFFVTSFLSEKQYLLLSGPPGGPLGFTLEEYRAQTDHSAPLTELIRAKYQKTDLELSEPSHLRLSGKERPAVAFTFGTVPARSLHCAVLFRPTERASEGILLDFWTGGSEGIQPSCKSVLSNSAFTPLLQSLRVKFPIE